jgi:hypothetical protein
MRFSSLVYVPAHTRSLLRDRLSRFLPAPVQHEADNDAAKQEDERILQLLLGLHIDFGSDVRKLHQALESATGSASAGPALAALTANGWMRVVWQRFASPLHVVRAAKGDPSANVIEPLLLERHSEAYRFEVELKEASDRANLTSTIERENRLLPTAACQTPSWVAARLWDRTVSGPAPDLPALRLWADRWGALGAPAFVPSKRFSKNSWEAFRDSVFAVLGGRRIA